MEKTALKRLRADIEMGLCGELSFDTGEGSFTRRFYPPSRLILLGGGHISQALCAFASQLDFAVTVVDDRPDFANSALFPTAEHIVCDSFETAVAGLNVTQADYVAVLTRGHRWDADCLRVLLKGRFPFYLGLVGSRRRVHGLMDRLEGEGYDRSLMQRICTPIGLPINAVTPKEIAVSILAELIAFRRREAREPSVLDRTETDMSVFDALLAPGEQVLAIVVSEKGSVPVDTGAMMAVGRLGRTAGTVGGGCGEYEVITQARRALRDGQSRLISLDMTADTAEDEGMVCGGTMKLWLEVCR